MNSESVRQAYTAYPYGGEAVSQSHPARLAAVAGLYGLPTPDVRHARILEVGCSRGFNLLPWAEQFPSAHFVGIDFSTAEIAEARSAASAAGLTNVELIETDLCAFHPEPGSFDYIIAHGVFSWVPDDVKAALLALCSRALSPQGLAYISYNTYPGWKQTEAIRDLLLMEIGEEQEPAARLRLARSALDRIEKLHAGRKDPHALEVQRLLARMRGTREGTFYHDELNPVNDPCYFAQFVSWADEYGLSFVGEAMFETVSQHKLQAANLDLPDDRLKAEQWSDYSSNRTFRSSLLTRRDLVAQLTPCPDHALRRCCFRANLRPSVGMPDLTAGIAVGFSSDQGISFKSEDPVVKALYTVLADTWPAAVDFDELGDRVKRSLVGMGVTLDDTFESALLARLLDGCGRRLLDFMHAGMINCVKNVSPCPRVSRLNRVLAKRHQPPCTPRHEPVTTPPGALELIGTLDGERDAFNPAEHALLACLAQAGLLTG